MKSPGFSLRPVDDGHVRELRHALGVGPVTARCLAVRGIVGSDLGRAFLSPRLGDLRAPTGLSDLPRAVERLARAALCGEKIGVFGDYDVDGVTTSALVSWASKAMGAHVSPRVARREAGYGFSMDDLERFAQAGCSLVVTGDCGTSDYPALNAAKTRGIDVIVIDHHTVPAADEMESHPAYALVNPRRLDSTFPFQGLASVGLAFYVMQAVKRRLHELGGFAARPAPDLRDTLDLVALGTVADLVPLSRENRILTAYGLKLLAERRRPGISALLSVAGVGEGDPIDERTVGWKLAPRLNAPGRLGDAAPSLELLLTTDPRRAAELANAIELSNQTRRAEQDRVLAEADIQLGNGDPGPAVVLAGRGWAPGVVGIVAARLSERFSRPAFVVAIGDDGIGRGSARGFASIDVYRALTAASSHLERFGGHAAAAGLTVREDNIAAARQAICTAVESQGVPATSATAQVDAEVSLGEIDFALADELASLAPFGKGNEAPILAGRRAQVLDSRRVGDGSHLKLTLGDYAGARISAIGFGLGALDPGAGATIDLAFTPSVSTYRGSRRVEIVIRQIHPTDSG